MRETEQNALVLTSIITRETRQIIITSFQSLSFLLLFANTQDISWFNNNKRSNKNSYENRETYKRETNIDHHRLLSVITVNIIEILIYCWN